MKKTAISLLLAVVMVFSLVLVAAPAAQATTHTHCVCNGATIHSAASHTCDATTTYTALDQATASAIAPEDASAELLVYPLQGTYYLTENVSFNGRIKFTGDLTICLNGFKLQCADTRFGDAGFTVNITDCSAGQTGELSSNSTLVQMFFYPTSKAAAVNVWGGNIKSSADGSQGCVFRVGNEAHALNIYGGTIHGSNAGVKSGTAGQGGAIRASASAQVNMYGGTITGGKAITNASGAAKGGNVYIGGGIFSLYGGTITGGSVEGEGALGGNICLNSGSLKIYGGTITGSTSADGLYVAGGKLTIDTLDSTVKFEIKEDYNTEENLTIGTGVKLTNEGNLYTAAKKSAGGNANTGDSANLVVMGLGLVLGVAGMACLLPKKQKV